MRIVDRKTFLSLPPETVFAKYEHCVFGELQIKGESYINDYRYYGINDAVACSGSNELFDILYRIKDTGESVGMDFDNDSRDGLYDDNQLFAVWDKEDVLALIARLQRTLNV